MSVLVTDFKLGSQSRIGSNPLRSRKRTKNVNELQVAVIQWELTLVEHESNFSEVAVDSEETAAMRSMLPKDVLERFFDGPFQYQEPRDRVSAYVGEKLAGQDANSGAQPVDIGQIDKSEGENEDVNAVLQRRQHSRSNQKHKQESDNERKPLNRRTANSSPSASRQSTTRDRKVRERRHEAECGEEEASHLLQVWWKKSSCQALPISG